MDGNRAAALLEDKGFLEVELKEETVELKPDEVRIQKTAPADREVMEEEGVLVALDTEISPDLLREGLSPGYTETYSDSA